ncbi:MAG: protoporphyrinogen oxidase [Planctomycetaceae bacterium]|nr:protoporphyrinogen oxidase [Planctomycetaceae bacterium]
MNIAILGAGISGLAAAHRLHQILPHATLQVFDRRGRTGGLLETISRDGLQIEQSADNFITTTPWGLQLCKELGLTEELIQTNPNTRRTYVVRKGKLHLLPDGFLMMAPTKLLPMAITPILSPLGKLRAGLELLIPSRKDEIDESMANFVRRRLGREVFERLVEPLVSGVYAADMEKLSVRATLPRFREMERQYGSLIWAMQRQLRANKAAHLAEQSGARYSMFVTLKKGLSVLGETIAQKLPSGTLQLNTEVTNISRIAGDAAWQLTCESQGDTAHRTFDVVIIATSTTDAAKLLRDCLPTLADKLGAIEHEGTAIATFAFDSSQIQQEFRGMGFVVPKIERSPILAGSFSSIKYEHRAPSGKFLIRVFAGGARRPELAEMPGEQLAPLLLQELRKVIKIDGEPILTMVAHWPNTMPQYNVGHCERIQEIESLVSQESTLALAGNAFLGVGIPSCIQTGYAAAEKVGTKCN